MEQRDSTNAIFPEHYSRKVGRLAAADRKLRDGDENLHLRAELL